MTLQDPPSPTEPRPVRVGLVGYGYAGRTIHVPLIRAVPGLALSSVATSDPQRVLLDLPRVRIDYTPQELFEDPGVELVVLAVPNHLHAPMALAALDAGKHVVVDKPFTETWDQARALTDLARRTGRVLSVFHNRRFDADFLTVRRILASGELGQLAAFESRFDRFRPRPTDRWRERPSIGGGVWFDLGAHLVDQAVTLFGLPDELFADISTLREGGRVDDDFMVMLAYPRLRVLLRASCLAAAPTPRFTLQGDRAGYAKFGLDPQEDALRRGDQPGEGTWGLDGVAGVITLGEDSPAPRAALTERGDWRRYYEGVRDAIRGVGPNPVPPEEATAVMAILELARESAAAGRRIAVATDRRFQLGA